MSFLVTRLWIPVPSRPLISTPCSEAILRTSGDDRWRIRSSNDATVPPSLTDSSSEALAKEETGSGEGRGEGAAAAGAGAAGVGAGGFSAACGAGAGGAAAFFSAGAAGLFEAAGAAGVSFAGVCEDAWAAAGLAVASPASPMVATTVL